MPNPADYHIKLMIGELVAQIAVLRAELEAAREQLAQTAPAVAPVDGPRDVDPPPRWPPR